MNFSFSELGGRKCSSHSETIFPNMYVADEWKGDKFLMGV
jgi:hypothetical protein